MQNNNKYMLKTTNLKILILLLFLIGCNSHKKQLIQDAPLISDTFIDSDSTLHKIEPNQKWVLWAENHILLAKDLGIQSPYLFINPSFPDSIFSYFTDEQAKEIQNYKFIIDSDEADPSFLATFKNKKNQLVNFRTLQLGDILYQIRVIGKIFGKEKEANRMADSLMMVKNEIQKSMPKNTKTLKVVMVLNIQPLMVAGSGSYLQEMINICGFQNIFEDKKEASVEVDIKEIIQKQPDIIFAISDDLKFSEQFIGLSTQTYRIPAIQNEKSFQLSPFNFLGSNKECFLGLYQMAKSVYPTALEPFDSLTKNLK